MSSAAATAETCSYRLAYISSTPGTCSISIGTVPTRTLACGMEVDFHVQYCLTIYHFLTHVFCCILTLSILRITLQVEQLFDHIWHFGNWLKNLRVLGVKASLHWGHHSHGGQFWRRIKKKHKNLTEAPSQMQMQPENKKTTGTSFKKNFDKLISAISGSHNTEIQLLKNGKLTQDLLIDNLNGLDLRLELWFEDISRTGNFKRVMQGYLLEIRRNFYVCSLCSKCDDILKVIVAFNCTWKVILPDLCFKKYGYEASSLLILLGMKLNEKFLTNVPYSCPLHHCFGNHYHCVLITDLGNQVHSTDPKDCKLMNLVINSKHTFSDSNFAFQMITLHSSVMNGKIMAHGQLIPLLVFVQCFRLINSLESVVLIGKNTFGQLSTFITGDSTYLDTPFSNPYMASAKPTFCPLPQHLKPKNEVFFPPAPYPF
ncbi:hypothetical protein VP01_894g2 [Puccinia sorghi]|uniref:Uncharacterized protein n=1 Tax=Puccinia sorghi TaxID=27349 RepID=A0A0L6UA44_9BASI|nr:hypothetical protein VP01_894g2 [Puccinia sorghi]